MTTTTSNVNFFSVKLFGMGDDEPLYVTDTPVSGGALNYSPAFMPDYILNVFREYGDTTSLSKHLIPKIKSVQIFSDHNFLN